MADYPNKRPKPSEDEETLLRMQEEFNKNKLTPCAKVENVQAQKNSNSIKKKSKFAKNRGNESELEKITASQKCENAAGNEFDIDMEKLDDVPKMVDPVNRYYDLKDTHLILGNIVERKIDLSRFHSDNNLEESNPSHKEKLSNSQDQMKRKLDNITTSHVVTGPWAKQIHDENLEKLKEMSNQQILTEKKNLEAMLDPNIMAFMKSIKNKKLKDNFVEDWQNSASCSRLSAVSRTVANDNENTYDNHDLVLDKMEIDADNELKELPRPVINIIKKAEEKGWVHMDEPEPEKLKWMEDLRDEKKNDVDPEEPYNARFDFNGVLLPFNDASVTVDKGLHHHGEEPERPGYSLQELLELSRKNNQQQRCTSLTALSNILEKTHLGWYDRALQPPLFDTLNQKNFLLMLRFSLDDKAVPVMSAALLALRSFFFSETDEICLDKNFGVEDFEEPCLKPNLKDIESTESLKDHELTQLDSVSAAMRSDIVLRIRFILSEMQIPIAAMTAALEILARLARHSHETALNIACTPNLLEIIVQKCLPLSMNQPNLDRDLSKSYGCPLVAAVRLCRILITYAGRPVLDRLRNLKIVHSLLSYISTDANRQFVHLHIESLRLWRLFLHHGYERDSADGARLVMISQLRLLATTLDLKTASPLTCDYAAALIAISKYDEPLKEHAAVLLSKWSSQLSEITEANRNQTGLVAECLKALHDVSCLNCSWLQKPQVFDHLSLSSNLLSKLEPAMNRDSDSLPSLGVMTCEGKLQPIMDQNSNFVFIKTALELFLKFSRNSEIVKIFQNENVQKYLKRLKNNEWSLERSWFTRVEYSFLITLIQAENELKITEKTEMSDTVWKIAIKLISALPGDCPMNVRDILIFSLAPERIHLRFLECGLENLGLKEKYKSVEEIKNPSLAGKLYEKFVSLNGKWSEAAMPKDWLYLPLVEYHTRIKVDTFWSPSYTLDIINLLKLQFIMPELTQNLPPTLRFSRLLLLYLCDAVFVHPPENELPQKMIAELVEKNYKKIDLSGEVPGLNSFTDMFTALCENFLANSYGQTCFAQALLVFLAQRYDVHYRKLLWSEHAGSLRYINLTPDQLLLPYEEYLHPIETDTSLIEAYITALVRNTIKEQQSPVMYKIALHHAAMYLKESNKLATLMRSRVERLLNDKSSKSVAEKLLYYGTSVI